jgi:hypothetical protein
MLHFSKNLFINNADPYAHGYSISFVRHLQKKFHLIYGSSTFIYHRILLLIFFYKNDAVVKRIILSEKKKCQIEQSDLPEA